MHLMFQALFSLFLLMDLEHSKPFISNSGPKPQNFRERSSFGPSGFINFCQQKTSHLSGYFSFLHYVGAGQHVRNPLNPFRHIFWLLGNFFCAIYIFLLMSNKNLFFFAFKHHIGGDQQKKMCMKSSTLV